jgi:hypothetical protein
VPREACGIRRLALGDVFFFVRRAAVTEGFFLRVAPVDAFFEAVLTAFFER